MKSLAWHNKHKTTLFRFGLVTLLLIIVIPLAAYSQSEPPFKVRDLELISVGKGGVQGNSSSYHVATSEDGRFAAFISFSSNWAVDQPELENWLDIFVRDRQNDVLRKITYGPGGELTDESSYDPLVTADGRYISYWSYASNLIANDTNGHEWLRQGIDVFMYDMQSKKTKRVNLDSDGGEIKGNSIGWLTPDGRSVVFASNGRVITGQSHDNNQSAIYLRDLISGQVEQISKGTDDLYPNSAVDSARGSFDGRYIVYASGATNLVPNDTNGVRDLFLYDRSTGDTKLFPRAPDGSQANGRSSAPQITYDGRYIVFLSSATNLVVGDTNGRSDIFVFNVENGTIRRVNVAEDGTQSNGLTKDPSICNTGRFVSFTTEATNLVPGDTNGQRDIILHDLVTGRNTVATINETGEWGNRRAHRSYLVPDCRAITFASDATNLVADDTNNKRDLFMGQIYLPADLSPSTLANRSFLEPGDRLVYTYTVRNVGFETSSATLISKVPTDTIYVDGSVTGGGIFNSAENQMEWQVAVTGGSEIKFSYAVTVDASLVDPTLITNRSILSNEEWEWMLEGYTMVNGRQTYFPLIKFN